MLDENLSRIIKKTTLFDEKVEQANFNNLTFVRCLKDFFN